ncbi:hypothetical protein MAR_021542, partial [Mya arenaria]
MGTNGETVSQSANLKLICTSTRNDIKCVRWYHKTHDGTCEFDPTYTVPANMKCDCMNISMYTCTLISVQEDIRGDMWSCRFAYGTQNMLKFSYTNTLTIDLADGPKMRILQDISVVQGGKFEYPCLYEPGNPPAVSFEWTRSESVASWIKQEKQNLTISTVQRSDEANYTCNVSSILRATLGKETLKYDTATFHLNFYEFDITGVVSDGAENLKLRINNVSNASVEIEENTTNHIQCSLESDPASNITILKDGKTMIESHGVHQLTHEIKPECSDTGVYTCSGYNEYGAAENASIYLCTEESDGSCYRLSDKVRKIDIVTGTPTSSLTILDIQIEDYGMYQFSVHNDIGSPLIEWLHLKPPIAKPDPPSDFHVIQEEISETSAVLAWVPGFDNGSPQTFYITYGKKGDSSGWITKSVEHTYEAKINYTLRNLETETEYIASINASNEKGSTTTINDITFITLKHIPGVQTHFPTALIGGAVGGGIAVGLVIIGLIFLVKKMRIS